MIDRYSVFTALEEDVYKLGVMSKFYYWNENDFFVSTVVCDLHEVSQSSYIIQKDYRAHCS